MNLKLNKAEKVIAFILKGYPRLSETFILNEILLLEKLGFKLHIFAMRNPGESKIHDNVHKVKAPVAYIPDYFWQHFFPFIISHIRLLIKTPRKYFPPFCFAAWRSIRLWNSAAIKRFSQAVYFTDRCLPGANIAFFYAHFSHDPTTMTYFASRLTGIDYGISAHAKDIYLQDSAFLNRKVARAQFVTTCTGFNADFLKKAVESTTPIMRCYHGINLDVYRFRGKKPFNDTPQILSVGRLVPKKGFPVLLNALKTLKEKGQKFHHTIIGSGPLKGALKAQISRLGLSDCVTLHPEMSQQELHQHYQTADVFALACEVQDDGDRDGIPNVIVEAMATGIPVIATRISGIPECVEDGVSGILVEQRDSQAFAEGLLKLLINPEIAQQYAVAGRKKVEQLFDNTRNVKMIGDVLHRALHNGKGLKTVKYDANRGITEMAVTRT